MGDIVKFGFCTIESEYLRYLNSIDSEVYYNASYRDSIKPFVGIIVLIDSFKYFIPISSAKRKHIGWRNVSDEYFLIYEIVGNEGVKQNGIYKVYNNDKWIHIMSILDIKKMIPVPEGVYQRIDFKLLEDFKYKDLFEKEYKFCLSIKAKILLKAEKLYEKQKVTGIVRKANCHFEILENAMLEWSKKTCTNPSILVK